MSCFRNVATKLCVNKVILDASALLAVFFREDGGEIVEPVLYGSTMSAVNYSEVLKKAVEKRGSANQARFFIDQQAINIVPFDALHGLNAASILPQVSAFGLSFADRACVSLGMMLKFKVYTAEKRMSEIDLGIKVKLIRERSKTATR